MFKSVRICATGGCKMYRKRYRMPVKESRGLPGASSFTQPALDTPGTFEGSELPYGTRGSRGTLGAGGALRLSTGNN